MIYYGTLLRPYSGHLPTRVTFFGASPYIASADLIYRAEEVQPSSAAWVPPRLRYCTN